MPFTDDDIAFWKGKCAIEYRKKYKDTPGMTLSALRIDRDELYALIARMEAAEACFSDTEECECSIFDCWHERTRKAWRAAAGKS